jgi:hypothetical protein
VAGGEETLVLPFRGRARGRATARIATDDDLAADDRAYAVLNVPEPRRVLLASPGNFYLQSVLAAMPNVEYTAVDAVAPDDLQRQAQAYDIVILDRVAVPALPRGNFLLVDTLPAGLPFTARGEVEAPVILGQGTSSLVRDLDLSAVGIEAARRVAVSGPVPGLQRLFWSAQTPLALALLQEGRRVVYLGFDLTRSSLPLETAFPLLIGQSLDWLRPADSHAGVSQLAAGEAHLIQVPSTHTDLILRTPDGEGQTHLLEDGELRFDATSVAGIYRYSVNQVARYFAVNLTDARESNINSAALPARRAEAVSGDRADAQAVLPLWWALSALALALLALEWTVWCARRGDA